MATTVTVYRLCVDGDMENRDCCSRRQKASMTSISSS